MTNSERIITVKISRFTIFIVTVAILLIYVTTVTTVELNRRHEEKLIYSMETKIEYYAKRCYLENNCKGMITLKDLYERKYLTEVVHPVTKEIIDETTTISYVDNKIIINWK